MEYAEVFSRLSYETAIITFFKKDGSVRVMLGTRNINTASIKFGFLGQKLGGHDNRCNINNGNLALIDLIVGDARSFSIGRLVDIQWLGQITNNEQFDGAVEKFVKYKEEYEKNITNTDVFDNINKGETNDD